MKHKTRERPAASEAVASVDAVADEKERVAKVMARAGLCSRRDAEAWIKAGRVAVNGVIITSPALNVGPDETIAVDGQTIEARERTRLFLYHKPRGLVTTAKDPEGRSTVFDNLPEGLPRVVSVGRLDINTEGLLLLTNDGGLARMLELPATGWLRRYRVRANGFITEDKLHALKDGIAIDGVHYAGIEAQLDRQQGANMWLSMGLREGKNREIKRVLEHLGLVVNRLIRLSFGPFQLGELAEGEVEEVRTRVLKEQLGPALAAEAGVEWEDAIKAEVVTREVQHREHTERAASPARGERPRRGSGLPAAQPPRQDRPAPGARPHVSALRAERPTRDDGPRKRISRGKTEDRKGRTVAVERITVEDKGRHQGGGGTSRNARNFARDRRPTLDAEAAAARPARRTRSEGSATRGDGGARSERPARGTRPPREDRAPSSERPPRRERSAVAERSARTEGASRRYTSERDDRPARAERPAGAERPARNARPARDDKPGRSGEPRGSRGGFGSDRPQTGRALKEGRTRSPARPSGEDGARPPRSPDGRPARSGPKPGGSGPRGSGPKGTGPKGTGPKAGGNRPRSRG